MPNRGSRDFKQFQKDTASAWLNLPDTEKKPFVDEMHRQMKEYQKLMVEWERKMIKLGNTDIVRQDALIEPKPKTIKPTKKHEQEFGCPTLASFQPEHVAQELQTGQDQCRKQQEWDTGDSKTEATNKNDNVESVKRSKDNLVGKLKGFFKF